MAFEEEGDEERPRVDPPLPPDDRLWRHPSELAGGAPVPAAWPAPVPRPGPRRSIAIAALASACLAGATVAMGVMWFARPTRVVVREAPQVAARSITTAVFSPAGVPSTALAKRMAPSLVQVEASREDEWISGTGIQFDDQGTIAVATSVVDGAGAVMVTAPGGTRVRATTVGTDPATGMTILTAGSDGGSGIAAAPVEVEAGDPVVVISATSISPEGSPEQRVVTAAVSAVGLRSTTGPIVRHNAVQLDRPVPDDALGGVVVDADGNLVGIVLAGTGTDGLAVVIPATDALAAARGLRDDGEVRRAWLGVRAIDLSPAAAELLSVKGGALLTEVESGSPAVRAGLRPGDVITAVDGQPIGDASDLVVALRAWQPGERVEVEWRRGLEDSRTDVILGG